MRSQRRKMLAIIVLSFMLIAVFIYYLTSSTDNAVDLQPRLQTNVERHLEKHLQETLERHDNIPYHLKESVAGRLATNGCVCEGEEEVISLPFAHLLFPHVAAEELRVPFEGRELEYIKRYRSKEYHNFHKRTQAATDLLIVAQANSPLQYPTQGVEVRPMKTVLIPGLGLEQKSRQLYSVSLTATLGTFDVAAEVNGVSVEGAGEMHMTLSSRLLSNLNRQLQFVTYTNTVFHPRAVDIVWFDTDGHQAVFTIKVGHPVTPKLYNPGPKKEYNISDLVTIATKTFLRYDKLQDLIDSVRQFYPTVTIVIADDNKHPKFVTGPYIEQYIMPFGKGWFAGRNLAVSQVSTKYVLWVDDDFYFTANTKLEKFVEVLESTTLDLVGGAVREVTGYTATFNHKMSVEEGDEDGDCLHMRRGHYHSIKGFPNCVVTDAVINFFMARTDKVRQVGFDPRLARIGHLEFFIDGLGSLHVGSCDDVIVSHASKIKLPWTQTDTEKTYAKFRYNSSPQNSLESRPSLFYLKNRFKCLTSN
ncbi:beta-1,4 N-acetylgalactosaminyltransferase 1a [Chanos chanos]|uniref:Beta-1,4 N-acetylgalactosaminyltransferase n=1 Tax=Chanos chanos TaxID=29144 RepID=A0A6J2V3B8_CHACN|nr:beta-1,4 N-acetylgalactosaminyltransferase 1-like [Chanos chanos]